MNPRINSFTKIMSLIVLILIPIIVLYWFSNRVSVDVVETEVKTLKYKDLSFFASKIDENILRMNQSALMLSEDMNVRRIQFLDISNLYEQTNEKLQINEKLRVLKASSPWDMHISIYAPETKTFITTNLSEEYDAESAQANYSRKWVFTDHQSDTYQDQQRFVRYIFSPYDGSPKTAGLLVEISFPAKELVKALDEFKEGGESEPFLLSQKEQTIISGNGDGARTKELISKLRLTEGVNQQSALMKLSGESYLVSSVWLPELGWHLVDYIPIQDVIRPITKSSYMFYASIAFLLLVSIPASYYLYRNIQVPIRELVRGVQKLKKGDYSTRVKVLPNNEFRFLIQRFNEMAVEMEQLIQNVYSEKLRSRDANLKQLQSQINPHFLYNSFALIRSLTRLGEKDSVMQLTLNLSTYYRYTTRLEKQTATIGEELELIHSYLSIQQLHVQGLLFTLDVPDSMKGLEIPRLLLQPLVENAVIHGIAPLGEGFVEVRGKQDDRFYRILITDNGQGISEEQLERLHQQLLMPLTEDTGCALWNTRQRMQLQFGTEAGLQLARREEGGFQVELYWPKPPLHPTET